MELRFSCIAIPAPARTLRPLGLCLLASLIALSARAEDDGNLPALERAPINERAMAMLTQREAPQASLTVDVTPAAVAGTLAVPSGHRLSASQSAAGSASVVDYRAWLGSGRASLGVGLTTTAYRDDSSALAGGGLAEARALNAGPLLAAPGGPLLGLGLRYQVSRDAHLTFDSLAASRADGLTPRMRVGMEFKSPPSQVLGMARGTFMRAQLSSDSQVSLNWRGGKVALLLRSQF